MVEKIFNSQSSQETKVYYGKSSETTKNEDDSTITKSSFKEVEIDENQVKQHKPAKKAGGVAEVV